MGKFFPKEIADQRYQGILKVIESGLPEVDEYPIQTLDRTLWLHVSRQPIANKDGEIESVLNYIK